MYVRTYFRQFEDSLNNSNIMFSFTRSRSRLQIENSRSRSRPRIGRLRKLAVLQYSMYCSVYTVQYILISLMGNPKETGQRGSIIDK